MTQGAGTLGRTGGRAERAAGEADRLTELWQSPPGWRSISAVNHTIVGRRFILTGFAFFLIAGVLALLMRTQLAVPNNTLLDYEAYNQIFTMHGTVMMFLFAVPMFEGLAIYFLPLMIGARDLPYPRLSAFGYWCYLGGGVLLLSSLFFGVAPDGGWFIYPPLTSSFFSPGKNIDFWLLGITFVEVSAIAAAVELVVAVLKTRAPGMSIDRMPLFVWYALVTALMIIFGFPPLIAGSILLELERAFGWPFFEPAYGGHPLLWQHLFWLFGHPEVYIILLPGIAMLTMIVPTMARHPIAGYRWFVLAAVGTGFLSFGLWVHHMYAVGIPQLSLAFFSAASMMVAIPSGIQVFGLFATLWQGRPVLHTPLWFVVGFVVIFVLGGFSGVMIAVVPFDLVVHDTQFIVAHFHYVLIGGIVFPLFAGIYYWFPQASGRMLSERLGLWSFGVMFAGFHLTFLPLRHTGLVGMPRRVFTYPAGLGWEWTNLVASIGAFVFALGVLLTLINIAWTLRRTAPAEQNPWRAGTLEWLEIPSPAYNFRSIPEVQTRYPLWDEPQLVAETHGERHYLPTETADRRLSMGSSIVNGRPEQVVELPGPTYIPLAAALCVGTFFVGFLAELYAVAALGAVLTLLAVVIWMWDEPDRSHPVTVPAGRGLELPLNHGLHNSPAWTGLVMTLAVDATLYASMVFGFIFLWSFAPGWPPPGLTPPETGLATIALVVLLSSTLVLVWALARMRRGDRRGLGIGLLLATGLGAVFLGIQTFELVSFGFAPTDHAYAALAYTLIGYQGVHMIIALVMVAMALLRLWRGDFAPDRHVGVRIAAWFWHYSVAIWPIAFALVYLVPANW